jgi:hypothetical protein
MPSARGAPRASDNHMGSSGAVITCLIIVEVSIGAAAAGYPVDKFYSPPMVESLNVSLGFFDQAAVDELRQQADSWNSGRSNGRKRRWHRHSRSPNITGRRRYKATRCAVNDCAGRSDERAIPSPRSCASNTGRWRYEATCGGINDSAGWSDEVSIMS